MFSLLVEVFQSLYSVWWWCAVSISVACVVYAVLLGRSDCDLALAFYSRLGRSPKSVLCGKVVWVTGASGGIGENLCYVLARCGAVIVLSARRKEELQRVLKRCKGIYTVVPFIYSSRKITSEGITHRK